MGREWPQTGLDLHPGGFPALIFLTLRRECPGVALCCTSSLEGNQPPQVCSLLPHRLNVFAVNTEDLIPLWVSQVSPHVQGGSHSLGPCTGEPAPVRDVWGAPAPRAGAMAALPGLSHPGGSLLTRNRPGTLQMSCDKPGQPQLCHLESLSGWRWRGGETWSSLVHGLQGPRGRRHSLVLCASSAFPSHPGTVLFVQKSSIPVLCRGSDIPIDTRFL